MKYKLDINRDVDGNEGDYLLWLPFGFRFSDEIVHVRGYDTIAEIRQAAKRDVVECDCEDCTMSIAEGCTMSIAELKAKEKAFLKSLPVD